MRIIFALLALLIASPSWSAILVQDPGGKLNPIASLYKAATDPATVGKTIVVTSALSAVQSNISTATLHSWPANRPLRVEKGGSINPTTKFSGLERATPEMFGAKGDGTTDDTVSIQRAINAGPCAVEFRAASYRINSTITLKTKVILVSNSNSVLVWGGGASTMIDTPSTGVLEQAGIHGLQINSGTASTVLNLKSIYKCSFKDIRFTTNSTTSAVVSIGVNTSGGVNTDGNRNSVMSNFDNLLQDGSCGTFIRMRGESTAVITLNTFHSVICSNAYVYGIDFAQWVDNNYFSGMTRLSIKGNNSIGVIANSADPTNNVGVYANNFDHLAVDTFGVYTGRYGVKLNNCKEMVAKFYYQFPVAEGGSLVTTTDTISYDFSGPINPTDPDFSIVKYSKGVFNRGGSYASGVPVTLTNNTAVAIPIDIETGTSLTELFFQVLITTDSANGNGSLWVHAKRTGGTPTITKIYGDVYLEAYAGALTGTTGTNNRITIGAGNDGKLYIENRLGFTVTTAYCIVNLFQK